MIQYRAREASSKYNIDVGVKNSFSSLNQARRIEARLEDRFKVAPESILH